MTILLVLLPILYIKTMRSTKKITIISLLTVLVIGVLVYNRFTTTPVVQADVTTTDVVTSTTIGQDILDLLNTFKTVSIDPTFFSSPLFQNLKDHSIILPYEQEGRANPFAPIGSDGGSFLVAPSPNSVASTTVTTNKTTKTVKK